MIRPLTADLLTTAKPPASDALLRDHRAAPAMRRSRAQYATGSVWKTIRIRKGLDLPIAGTPDQTIYPGSAIDTVALLPSDYALIKPRLTVELGNAVQAGQTLFVDRKRPEIRFVAPADGRVVAIHRGPKRSLLSIVLEVSKNEGDATVDGIRPGRLSDLTVESIKEALLESGLWTAIRQRPFGMIPSPKTSLSSIFVTAIDTHPLAADPRVVIRERGNAFRVGLRVLSRLAEKGLFLCKACGEPLPGMELDRVRTVEFQGPHPAGLPGTHIHLLDPAGRNKAVGYVNYQDVIEIGHLFMTGCLDPRRVIALAGPSVRRPRLIRTRLGADLGALVQDELADDSSRVVSGSVLGGRRAEGVTAFLGRYHLQISALPSGSRREFFGWLTPGFDRFSVKNIFMSSLLRSRPHAFSASLHGGHRALFPIGSFQRVMPLDVLPDFLLRALAVDDVEQAEALGCLELDEEDLALCTFVCPGKGDYGTMLRRNLEIIEREG